MSIYAGNEKVCSDLKSQSSAPASPDLSSRPYLNFYNLRESPFSITPDPEFLYMSLSHRDVLEKILYGILARMGFLLMIGEVGSGKTTLCRRILDELRGKAETVYLINPSLSGMDLIKSILDDLGINSPAYASKKESLDLLNQFLLNVANEKPVVIIIDDAQTMTIEGLETLRLLSNLETDKEKLLQLVLAGQEELLDILSKQEIRQLRQRIAISCRLEVLRKSEIQGYISHRLFVAGDKGSIRFSAAAIKKIYQASRGIPRLINKICDCALSAGYVSNSPVIKKTHVRQALTELDDNLWAEEKKSFAAFSRPATLRTGLGLSILCLLILTVFLVSSKTILDSEPQQPNDNQNIIPAVSLPSHESATTGSWQKTDAGMDFPHATENAEPSATGTTEAPQEHLPFILQLASYKNKNDVLRAVPQFEEQGISVQWNPVDIGDQDLWYRLYTGRFPSREAAKEFQREKGLSEGIIIKAPWTIFIAASDKKDNLTLYYSRLDEGGYDCRIEGDEESGYKLSTGAFISFKGAARIAEEIAGMGFEPRVIQQ